MPCHSSSGHLLAPHCGGLDLLPNNQLGFVVGKVALTGMYLRPSVLHHPGHDRQPVRGTAPHRHGLTISPE